MASGTAASVKLCATGLQRPRVLTLKIELMSACGTFRTSSDVRSMVAIRAKADIERLDPEMVPRRRTLR